jgi:antitoxin HicB
VLTGRLHPVKISRDENGRHVAESRDVPEAITDADERATAFTDMSRALGAALAGYVMAGRPVPVPATARAGEVMVPVEPLVAAKLALRNAMRVCRVTNSALARRLDVTEAVVRRLVDPDHASRLDRVVDALQTLGTALAIEEVHFDASSLSASPPARVPRPTGRHLRTSV